MKAAERHADAAVRVVKLDRAQQLIWGWASVTKVHGQEVIDLQNDIIETDELQKAVHEFMSESRTADEMHDWVKKGEVVDSIVFTEAVQRALGVDLQREGWFVGIKIHDKALWKRIESGELRSFSIGGSAESEPVLMTSKSAIAVLDALEKTLSPGDVHVDGPLGSYDAEDFNNEDDEDDVEYDEDD